LEAGAAAEDGDVAVAAVGVPPAGLEIVGAVLLDVLIRGEDTAGDRALAEELGRVLLGGDAEADGLAGVLDGGEAEDLAGGGECPDVLDGGGVDLLAVDPPDDAAVDLDADAVRG
jgi:hypothetical protein